MLAQRRTCSAGTCSTSSSAPSLVHLRPCRSAACAPGHRTRSALSARAAGPTGNMVVAVDNTQASWSSVKWALKNLYKEGMVLHLMHVVPKESTRPPMALSASYGVWDSGLEEDVEGHTRSLVDDFRPALDRLAVKYGAVCEVDVVRPKRSQHVGASICERSEELDAIVVVVTHRQYGLLEALLNRASVSDYVAKNCKKPVLVYQHRSGAGSTVLDIVQPAAAP